MTIPADGIHLEARLEEQAQCNLVIIGATPEGKKELIGFTDSMRESSQSWRDLLLDLKRHGLTTAPQIAVADGALGFWKALGEVWPTTREQRCFERLSPPRKSSEFSQAKWRGPGSRVNYRFEAGVMVPNKPSVSSLGPAVK